MIRLKIISIALLGSLMLPHTILAQCATVLGSDGIATANPSWYSCSGSNELQIETASDWSDLVIDWGDGTSAQSIGTFITDDVPLTHSYEGIESNYTITLSEADGSCALTGHFNIGMPEGNFTSSDIQVCQGGSIQFSQEAIGVDYAWNFGANDLFLPTSAGNVSFTFQNAGEFEVQSVISIPGMEETCTDTASIFVEVLSNPVIETSFSATEGCGEVTLSAEVSAANAFIYVWTYNTDQPMFTSGTTLDEVTFDTVGNNPVSITVTGWNGCMSSSQEMITVHPQPTASFNFDAVCQGEPTLFNDESTAHWSTDITGWNWTFGDGNESFESNPSNDYMFTGDYNVSLVVTTPECSASTSQLVSVHPNPTVGIVSSVDTGCSPLEVNLTANGLFANAFDWNLGTETATGEEITHVLSTELDENPAHELSVTVTSNQGCTATEFISIEVLPSAQAEFSIAADAGCAPFTPVIANASLGANNFEWWLNGALASSSNDWNTALENDGEFISNASLELFAIAENGCHDSTLQTVQIYPQPDFSFALPTDSVCSPLEFTLPMINGSVTHEWNLGNGATSTEETPNVFYQNTGTGLMGASITYAGVSPFGCTDMHTETVYIRPQPVASFTSDEVDGCEPLAANFENTTINADSYIWDFDNGITDDGETASYAFSTSGDVETFTVTLTAIDDLGCSDVATQTVTVYPAADFELDLSTAPTCAPVELTLPSFEGLYNFDWNFGDGTTSTENGPTHTWENNTDNALASIITLEAETEYGCGGMAVALLQVKPSPTADFTSDVVEGCEPLSVNFSSESIFANAFNWDFGNGEFAITENAAQEFFTNGENTAFDVTLTVTHELGCTDTVTETVTAFPSALVDLAFDIDSVCSPLTMTMPTFDGVENITWNFGDGTTSNEVAPSHTWENNTGDLMAATVTFSAQTENGCAGTASTEVFIKPQPVAQFSTDFDNGCEPLVSQFGNNSANADTFDWNFGNGDASSDENPSMVFLAEEMTETFTVTLTATDNLGCFDTATQNVTVHPGAEFTLDLGNDSVCSPLIADMPAFANAQNITWNFGDGTTSNEAAPSHTWENNTGDLMAATVTFSAQTENGCAGNASTEVFIKPQPVAAFTASETSGCEPLMTTFANSSTNGDAYIWNFGEILLPGEFNMSPAVDHEFNAIGDDANTFSVTLLAIDDLGCTDELTMDIEVLPAPEFTLALAETEACSPLVLTLPDMGATSGGFWSFGDGTFSNESTPNHSWSNTGMDLSEFSIEFQGANAFGCTGNASANVNVKPQPIAAFSTVDSEGCAPFEASLINMSERADSYTVDFGNETSESNEGFDQILHTFAGTESVIDYTVVLTAMHDLGCSDVHEEVITVFPSVAAAWTGATEGCAPFNAAFALDTTEVANAIWNLNGETFTGDALSATLEGASGTTAEHIIGLEVTSDFGCQDSTNILVTVHPVPVLSLSTSSSASCSDEAWMIFNGAQFADSSALTFSNGSEMINPSDSIVMNVINDSAEDLIIEMTHTVFTNFGCTAASGLAHIIHPAVTADFAFPEAACTPLEAGFINNSVNATGAFAWSFGDGSTSIENSPTHVFSTESVEDTTFQVSLLATNEAGCADSTSVQVIVFGRPVADIALENLEGCYPVDATFANSSIGHTATSWNYGNGEFGAISDSLHTKTFFNPTEELITYTTVLNVMNDHNCEATASVTFDVAPHLNAEFDMVLQGCSPVDGQLINQSEGAASFIWNFNDGSAPSNEADPSHVFVNTTNEDQTFQVELVALSAYGCTDTVTVGIEVYPMPQAEFSVTPAVQTYPNTTVGINNNSMASSSAVQYWSFGDGDEVAADQPIFHTFDSWGTYNITLLVDNGICADAHTEQINILSPNPVASFVGGGTGCAPLMVEFENNSNHGAGYVWNFDDDHMTSEESPVHVFTRPGTYNVSLTVIGFEGQEEQVIHYAAVEVFPSATAAFVNSPTEVIIPDQPVEFVNLSDDESIEFLWNFGDGQVSTVSDPIHFYTEPGIYDVTLTANNAFNCPTSYTLEHAVEATTGGFMEFPTAFTPINGGGNGGGYDPAALDNDVFHPHHTGIVEYELIVFNKWGELIFRSTDVYVGWDGYYEGVLARQDVYAWKATAQFSNGHRVTKAGDVTLIVQ
jgi:PKD repeat protein